MLICVGQKSWCKCIYMRQNCSRHATNNMTSMQNAAVTVSGDLHSGLAAHTAALGPRGVHIPEYHFSALHQNSRHSTYAQVMHHQQMLKDRVRNDKQVDIIDESSVLTKTHNLSSRHNTLPRHLSSLLRSILDGCGGCWGGGTGELGESLGVTVGDCPCWL